jgi:NAD(P)-dependent dehydrogenase (short-subunit alcohol dehydrogenase family)
MSGGPFDLTGKVALVTGGGRGIGAGIVRMLAEAGASVAIADRNEGDVLELAEALRSEGLSAKGFVVELAEEVSIVGLVEAVAAQLGTPWVLVNNAGVHDRELLLDATAAEFDRINAINARAPFLLTREVGRLMVTAGEGGRIVNVSSSSLIGQMVKGLASYISSKGALAALTKVSALELVEHGITVNTVLPGGVGTPGAIEAKGPLPEGPARRPPPLGMCQPADIAGAVLYFASPVARYCTNQTLCVDAGWSIS